MGDSGVFSVHSLSVECIILQGICHKRSPFAPINTFKTNHYPISILSSSLDTASVKIPVLCLVIVLVTLCEKSTASILCAKMSLRQEYLQVKLKERKRENGEYSHGRKFLFDRDHSVERLNFL